MRENKYAAKPLTSTDLLQYLNYVYSGAFFTACTADEYNKIFLAAKILTTEVNSALARPEMIKAMKKQRELDAQRIN